MIWTQKTATLLSMLVPLMALAVPLLDVSLAILRRFLSNRPVFSADRAHIHHRLLDRGLTPRKAVFLLYFFAAIVAGIAVLLTSPLSKPYQSLIGLVILGLILVAVRQLRYQEFQAASQFFTSGELQNRVRYRLSLDRFSEALQKASSRGEAWKLIEAFAETHRCASVRWASADSEPEYFASFGSVAAAPSWTFSVSLPQGELTFTGCDVTDPVFDVPSLARALQSGFRVSAPSGRSAVESGA
jgi:UDP-GlcNAc:undecaprenyl-phosphate GlcNAc-1-phosphate transferase